ncbi:hypothetical protein B0F90DRAFT_634114 [Multifurca ochricompacta]|uniref:Uncharacterized protein n=1 Tax=Multifurca ochricompacta TaxID=376703 RepID=A0AAD4M207_9AGAM|nr:hypothetical protein B0F90DRAFT_634114 [Multifurca ochricompacta]
MSTPSCLVALPNMNKKWSHLFQDVLSRMPLQLLLNLMKHAQCRNISLSILPKTAPPISLAYHGFGCFRAHMDGQDGHLMGRMPKSKARFEAAVDEFLRKTSRFYDSEMDCAERARESLNEIRRFYFQVYVARQVPVFHRRRSSDDHAVGPPNLVEALIKVKNELGTTDCDGSVELAAYYTQFLESNTSQESR